MDLKDLTLFIKLVDAGSFTAAGKQLEMPKSTVSRRISQLEEELGVRLLNRTTRQIRLTEAGIAYHKHCLRIQEETENFIAVLCEEDTSVSGRVRLAMPVEFGVSKLNDTLFEFCSRYPLIDLDIDLDVRQGSGVPHLDLLKENLDLALVVGDPGIQTLVARNLGASHLEFFCHPKYLEEHGSPSEVADLSKHKLLFMPEAAKTPYSKLSSGSNIFTRGLHSNTVLMLREAARAGLGIATLPEWICDDAIDRGELVKVLPETFAAEAEIFLLYPDRHLPKRTRLLVDYLLEPETLLPWRK